MIHILLVILKIIGIVLLVILGLLLSLIHISIDELYHQKVKILPEEETTEEEEQNA